MSEQKSTSFFGKIKEIFVPEDGKGLAWLDRAFIAFANYRKADHAIPQEKMLLDMVERVAKKQDCRTPNVLFYENERPNAGSSRLTGAIYITNNMAKLLPPEQVEAILSHEMVHHKHRLFDIATVSAWFGALVGVDIWYSKKHPKRGFFKDVIVGGAVLTAIDAVFRSAVSRVREFEADREAVIHGTNPLDLANALETMEQKHKEINKKSSAESTIIDTIYQIPPPSLKKIISEIISTHPPTEVRTDRLKAMDAANQPIGEHKIQR
jgi:heat shock protein HtpX